jgi:hypothetical protein
MRWQNDCFLSHGKYYSTNILNKHHLTLNQDAALHGKLPPLDVARFFAPHPFYSVIQQLIR